MSVTGTTSVRLSPNVVALGIVSLAMGASSSMVHSLLPVFLVTVLGASPALLGAIEGIAEATTSAVKVLSGTSSDWVRRRKPLVLLGYGLSACVKPFFAIADTAMAILVARVADRLGKGMRDAPRDALLADLTPSRIRGSGYGLRHALYTLGAVGGPLAAMVLMTFSTGDFRLVFWIAVIPAAVSVAILALRVQENPDDVRPGPPPSFRWADIRAVPPLLWWTIVLATLLALARFSPAFLVLKAHSLGIEDALVPLAWVLMHAVYGATAYPFGVLSDRIDRRVQLGLGILCLFGAHVALAAAGTVEMLATGIALWGLQQGIIQGLLSALIANAAPDHLRGTAFGISDLVQGLAIFLASAGAGALWATGGSTLSFAVAAVLTLAAGLVLIRLPAARVDKAGGPGLTADRARI